MNRFYNLFSEIRKSIPRTDFEGVMRHLKAERHARGVSCWQQFVSMLFCQLGRPHGVRETEQGLRSSVTILGSSRKSVGKDDSPVMLSNPFPQCFARMQGVWIFGTICACARPVRGAGLPTRTRFPDSDHGKPSSGCSVTRMLESFAWFGGEIPRYFSGYQTWKLSLQDDLSLQLVWRYCRFALIFSMQLQ